MTKLTVGMLLKYNRTFIKYRIYNLKYILLGVDVIKIANFRQGFVNFTHGIKIKFVQQFTRWY